MTDNLLEYIERLLDEMPTLAEAEAEFKRVVADEPDMRAKYREWCNEQGYTERNGFRDYATDYFEQRNSVWDSLTDYDE